MTLVKIFNPKTKEFVKEYFIEERLKRNLDENVAHGQLVKKNKDLFMVVDGKEGSGKSTLAMQIGKYADPTLDTNRIVFSPDDFREAILNAKKGQCIIYDEAFTGFSSRSSLSPINRVLVSLAMQMRQKNLFIIIVLPTIFLLDKYIAMFRAKVLIHVYENKGHRGYFRLFNEEKKKLLILFGNKTMSYNVKAAYTRFKGRFYGKFALGDESIEKKYLKKKEFALADSEKTSMSSGQIKFKEQRDLMIWLFKQYTKLTYQQMEEVLAEYDFAMSFQQIGKVCGKFGHISSEKINEMTKNDTKEDKKDQKEPKFDIFQPKTDEFAVLE